MWTAKNAGCFRVLCRSIAATQPLKLRFPCEGKPLDGDRGNQGGEQHGPQQAALLADRDRSIQGFKVTFGKAQILHGGDNLSVLDEKRSVASQAGDDDPGWMDNAGVVEACHPKPALDLLDKL